MVPRKRFHERPCCLYKKGPMVHATNGVLHIIVGEDESASLEILRALHQDRALAGIAAPRRATLAGRDTPSS